MNPIHAATALFALTLMGCATLPPEPVESALYQDLRRVIETRERAGWVIDRPEIEDASIVALPSVCQVEPARREALATWLEAQIEAAGGPAKEAYFARGQDLGAVSENLTLERVHRLLTHTASIADQDCPFWLPPDPDFNGIQSDSDRFVLLLESRGGGELLLGSEGEVSFGGGGGGRLLTAWGIGDRITFGFGAEIGGGGAISESDSGNQEVTATFLAGVPFLLRFRDMSRLYDIEIASTVFFTPDGLVTSPGVRVMFGAGLSTERVSAFMPTAVVQLGYSFHPAALDLPALHILHIGTRVGIDIDP